MEHTRFQISLANSRRRTASHHSRFRKQHAANASKHRRAASGIASRVAPRGANLRCALRSAAPRRRRSFSAECRLCRGGLPQAVVLGDRISRGSGAHGMAEGFGAWGTRERRPVRQQE
ncbi:hypothetical protein CLOM_g22684 [Closterium sp. NIES-68]|nr:hypothetical protein CLOM_g22684 [Closterium sp. NIES-68]